MIDGRCLLRDLEFPRQLRSDSLPIVWKLTWVQEAAGLRTAKAGLGEESAERRIRTPEPW